MAMRLRWLVSTSTSALHATAALVAGRELADSRLFAALEGPAREFGSQKRGGADAALLLEHLVGLSAGIGNNVELARVALTKIAGGGVATAHAPALARWIAQVEAEFMAVHPESIGELELRSGPLREQWEARGDGLLANVVRMAEPELLVETADVVPVHPAVGGQGHAHHLYNLVRIEAVLANPFPDLPEVVRLAWLLAQLNVDLPRYQGEMKQGRAVEVGSLALLPAVCNAAQEVELVRDASASVARAVELWKLPTDAAVLVTWWETYCEARLAWPAAVAALDRMLA